MKHVLVTGALGQLGNALQQQAGKPDEYRFFYTDVQTLDITNQQAVTAYLEQKEIDYVLNCAAYTAVDRAEDEPNLCRLINRDAVRILGDAASEAGVKVMHISTDYVFDGKGYRPYVETDETAPMSVYGHTKLKGEQALLKASPDAIILRTSWLYSATGSNFVKTMLTLGKERKELKVVFDQVGTPTLADDLAAAMLQILQQEWQPGIYHFSNEGVCSWYDFARKIMQLAGLDCRVIPIESKDYPSKTPRPFYSVLNKSKIKKTFGLTIPHWEESLEKLLKELA